MNRDDIIRMAREATSHLSNHDSVRLQCIALLAFDEGAAAERDRMCEQFNIPKELAHEKAKSNETD